MLKDWIKLMFGEWYGFVAIGFSIATGFSLAGKNLILPMKMWVTFLFLSLLYASLASYRKAFKEYSKSRPDYQIKRRSFSIMSWLGNEQTNKVNSVYDVQFSANIEIRNHTQRPLDATVILDSIDSDWSLAKNISEIALEIRSNTQSTHRSATEGNPITLEALAITSVHIKTSIPFSSSNDTQGTNYLEHPGKIVVNLRFEPVGQKPTIKSIPCDLLEIDKSVEQNIVNWIRTRQNDEQGLEYLQIFKRYWGIKS